MLPYLVKTAGIQYMEAPNWTIPATMPPQKAAVGFCTRRYRQGAAPELSRRDNSWLILGKDARPKHRKGRESSRSKHAPHPGRASVQMRNALAAHACAMPQFTLMIEPKPFLFNWSCIAFASARVSNLPTLTRYSCSAALKSITHR